jgi:hypothetical protein
MHRALTAHKVSELTFLIKEAEHSRNKKVLSKIHTHFERKVNLMPFTLQEFFN